MENRALKWSFCRHQSLINVRHASIRSFKPAMAFETFELTSDYTLIKSLDGDFMVCWPNELVGCSGYSKVASRVVSRSTE